MSEPDSGADGVDVVWDLISDPVVRIFLIAYPIYVCFRKDKLVFALTGLLGILTPLGAVIPIVGASRLGKPNSPWALRHYSPDTLKAAKQRFPKAAALLPPEPEAETSQVADSGLSSWRRSLIIDFLAEAENRGIIVPSTRQSLLGFLDQAAPAQESITESPAVSVAAPAPDLPPSLVAAPLQVGQIPQGEAPPPAPAIARPVKKEPGPWALWKARLGKVGEAVASDLALHGFVYLGVLLTFVGVFGFLFFAFRDVPDGAQPFVELAIPLIFFLWAWALRRRQAMLIAKGMELLGGLVLPLVGFAGLVDNAPFPPDFRGGTLIAAMVTVSLLIALVYAWRSRRHPDSALAFLVAPLIWMAALVLGFIFKTDEPLQGVAITHLVSFQPALASAAIAATLAGLAFRRESRLALNAAVAAIPAAIVAYALTVALSFNEAWVRPVPVLLAGVATLISVELLGYRFARSRTVSALRPLFLAATLAPLIPIWGLAWTGVAMVVCYLAALEWDLRAPNTGRWVIPASLTGAVVGLAVSVVEPWAIVVAWAAASIWSHARRIVGLPSATRWARLDVMAAVLPFGLGAGLLAALSDDVAWLVMSVVVVAVVVAVRWFRSEDRFWAFWTPASSSAVALGAGASWFLNQGSPISAPWLVAAIVLSAASMAGSSSSPVVRIWLTSGALALALAVGLEGAAVAATVKPVVWALVGLTVVTGSAVWRRGVAPHLGLVGHLLGFGSLLAGGPPSGQALVLGAWTIGWLTTVVAGESEGATVSHLLERVGRGSGGRLGERLGDFGRALPQLVLAASTPFALLATAGLWESFDRNRAWSGVALGLLAVSYAAFARRLIGHKPLSSVLASGAAVLSVIGVAVSVPGPWETIGTAAASIVVAALLAGELRKSAFTWFAWVMSFVLVVLLANRAGVPVRSLDLVSLGWGGLLLIGGLVVDDLTAGRRQRGEGVRIEWIRPPVVLGALAVPLSLGPTFTQEPAVWGWWSLATAAAYFVVAYLLRVGAVAGPGYALAALGVTVLAPESPMARPWLFALIAAALVVCAYVAERLRTRSGGGSGWLGWDLPPLVVAHLVAGVALARAAQIGMVPSTAIGLGVLSLVVGLWRRSRIWAEAGNLLTLLAAASFGPGWLALALLATSIRGVVSALLASGWTRSSYQIIAAGAAGWAFVQTIIWQGWGASEAVSISALVFGGLAATVAALVRFTPLSRDWAMTWGGLAVVGIVSMSRAAPGHVGGAGPAVAIGLGLFAIASAVAARPLGAWLHYSSVVTTLGAWLALAIGLDWSVEAAAFWTGITFAALSVVVAEVARLRQPVAASHLASADGRSGTNLARTWAVVAALGVLIATSLGALSAERQPIWFVVAFSLALLAVASARQATPLGWFWLREVSGPVALGAASALAYAFGATAAGIAVVAITMGTAATGVSLALDHERRASVWLRPLLLAGAVANLEAFVFALALWPRRDVAVAVLLAVGVQAVAAGLVLARPGVLSIGPPLIAVAWLGIAAESFTGSVQWYTAPVAVTLLAEVEIARWSRRRGGERVSAGQLRLLEWAGIGLLGISPLAEMFTRGVQFGLLAFGYAAAVLIWSVLTRVRSRLVAALVLATITAALTISAAAAGEAPPSAFFWIVAAGAGIAVMLSIGLVESYRSKSGAIMHRLDLLMEGWE